MKHTLSFLSLLFIALTINAQRGTPDAAARPGTLDESFGDSGKVLLSDIPIVTSMALQKDGKIVVTGYSNRVVNNNAVIRFNQEGTLDTLFGNAGFVGIDFALSSIAIQDDGKIIAGGYRDDGVNNHNIYLARLLPNGNFDNTFGENGYVHAEFGNQEYCIDVKLQPDGKILASGDASGAFTNLSDFIIARYMPDGSVDKGFGDNGATLTDFGANEAAGSIAIQTDGKIVLSGGYSTFGDPNNSKCAFARYLPDGKLDTTFSSDGKTLINITSVGDEIRKISILSDGTIIGGGYAGRNILGEKQSFLLLSLNADGSLNKNFGGDGEVLTSFEGLNSEARSMAVQDNGKIILAGTVWSSADDNSFDFGLTRHNSDGSLDSSFGLNGKQITDFGPNYSDGAIGVAINNNNKIVAAGGSGSVLRPYLSMARYYGDPLSRITRIKRWIKHHVLNFQDLQANNTSYYSIERSSNPAMSGTSFTEIAHISASENTKEISQNNYSYPLLQATIEETTRNQKPETRNYYRIKAVDKDGSVAYSEVISETDNNALASSFSMYPNPVKDVLHVSGLNAVENTSVTIINIQGNIIKRATVNAASYDFNVSELKQGRYYLQVNDNNVYQFLKE